MINLKKLVFEDYEDMIEAYYNGEKIGYIQFLLGAYGMDGGYIAYPEQMHVCNRYQSQGVGTAIIIHAKEIYDKVKFMYDYGNSGNSNEIHYSDSGLAFKEACERKGITEEMMI